MGEAKRRKKLGLPPRKIDENKSRKKMGLPPKEIDKEELKKNVKLTLNKYPFIPFIFYGSAVFILILGTIKIINYYK
tara:strand:+ start:104 stop:334 length:231 start_codon:yes stop_codon:yes gene_type:complete